MRAQLCQAAKSMEFSRQEHWSGLPFPTPGDLPDPGIEPTSLTSCVLLEKNKPRACKLRSDLLTNLK